MCDFIPIINLVFNWYRPITLEKDNMKEEGETYIIFSDVESFRGVGSVVFLMATYQHFEM